MCVCVCVCVCVCMCVSKDHSMTGGFCNKTTHTSPKIKVLLHFQHILHF